MVAEAGRNLMSGRKVRLIDVASRAGVSRATAARVLGGYSKVRDERSERVLAAALELGYRANEIARAMRAGRTLTVGVVLADISNSFFGSAVRAIIDASSRSGYQTLIANTGEDQAKEIEAVRTLLEKRVDGLIVVPASPVRNQHLDPVRSTHVPTVLLDRRIGGFNASSVTSDDMGAARDAISHLLARGHERIGVVSATSAVSSQSAVRPKRMVSTAEDRLAGALQGLGRAGLSPCETMIRFSRSDPEHARVAASQLLDQTPRPTAILTTNEETAIGVLRACQERGLRVGRDLSLISFDDSPWAAINVPPLTVVRRPVYDMGIAAVECLLSALGGETPTSRILPNELIVRSSVFDLR